MAGWCPTGPVSQSADYICTVTVKYPVSWRHQLAYISPGCITPTTRSLPSADSLRPLKHHLNICSVRVLVHALHPLRSLTRATRLKPKWPSFSDSRTAAALSRPCWNSPNVKAVEFSVTSAQHRPCQPGWAGSSWTGSSWRYPVKF